MIEDTIVKIMEVMVMDGIKSFDVIGFNIKNIMNNNWSNIELINDINKYLIQLDNRNEFEKDTFEKMLVLKEKLVDVMMATNDLTYSIKSKVK